MVFETVGKNQKRTLFQSPPDQQQLGLQESRRLAELRYAAFTAEHNLPFYLADHAAELFPVMFNDSKISKVFQCKRTKTEALVKNVLGVGSFQELISILKVQNFSIIIDESNDIGTNKNLRIVARYFDTENWRTRDQFLVLLELTELDHVSLFNKMKKVFIDNQIPYKTNLRGFGADGASVMFGEYNYVHVLLKVEIPYIFTSKCVCHTFALVASNACNELPRCLEDLVQSIYSHFKFSSKRVAALKQFQEICDLKPHKMLARGQTCWLSLESVVNRVLEQWEALVLHFKEAGKNDKLLTSENIYNWLQDHQCKIFLYFLQYILPYFNKLNKLFQSEECLISELYEGILSLYKDILSSFIKKEFLHHTETLDPTNPKLFLQDDDLYFGAKVALAFCQLENDTEGKNQKMKKFI